MKRFLFLLCIIATIILSSCQADKTLGNIVATSGTTTISVSLAQTRTTLGSKGEDGIYPVYWSEGDKICVNGTLSSNATIDPNKPTSAKFQFNAELDYPLYISHSRSSILNVYH